MFSKLTNIFYGSKKNDHTKDQPKLLSFSINYEKVISIKITYLPDTIGSRNNERLQNL
jgi:hypothetical protein